MAADIGLGIKINVDVGNTDASIKKVEAAISSVGRKAASLSGKPLIPSLTPQGVGLDSLLGKLGGLAIGFVSVQKVASYFFNTLDKAEKISELSISLDASSDGLQRLHNAAKVAGKSTEEIDNYLKKMTVNLGKINDEGEDASSTITKIGLSVSELEGLQTDQKFIKIAEALGKVSDASLRAKYSVDIFGKSGVDAYRAVADTLGMVNGIPVLSEQQLNQINKVGDTFDVATLKAEAFGASLVSNITYAMEFWGRAIKKGVLDQNIFTVLFNKTAPQNILDIFANAKTYAYDTSVPLPKEKAIPEDPLKKKAEELIKKFTPEDLFQKTKELEELFKKGAISADIYSRALEDLQSKDPAYKAGKEAEKSFNEQRNKEIESILSDAETPLKKFQEKVDILNTYFEQGAISAEDASVAYQKYLDEFNRTDEETVKATKAAEDEAKKAEEIAKSVLTPQEEYNQKIQELNDLVSNGALDFETANRAANKYSEDLQNASAKIDDAGKAQKELSDFYDQSQKEISDATRFKPGAAFGEIGNIGAELAMARFGQKNTLESLAQKQIDELRQIKETLLNQGFRGMQAGILVT